MKTTRRPFCYCLYEIENRLPRTKFCFMPCHDQRMISIEKHKAELAKRENDIIKPENDSTLPPKT